MPPLCDRSRSRISGFEDHRLDPALQQMRASGEPLRASPDHNHGQFHHNLHILTNINTSRLP